MKTKSMITALLALVTTTGVGQGRQFLTDGVQGHDIAERLQFVQLFTPEGDTLLAVSDDKGRFEITPAQLEQLLGYFYLKPLITKRPKPKLTLENPFDSIDYYQRGRQRYMPQNYLHETDYGERDVRPNSLSASSTRPVSISPATRPSSLIACCQKRSGATSSIPPITSTLATTTVCRPSICY